MISVRRRRYIDWLRGLAVLIMVEAHTFDAWTAPADRARPLFGYLMLVAGLGAPMFLFLAGVSMALAIGGRLAAGAGAEDAARLARRRGWQIFGLAFLFRLQAWILSGGAPFPALLKVDILNVMGLAMVAAAALWGAARTTRARVVVLALAVTAVAMLTPVVRVTPYLDGLPDAIEAYFRPLPGRTTFTLFPWAGFVPAGLLTGLLLEHARTVAEERRALVYLAAAGPAVMLAAYGASLLPPIYADTNFWTSSPTFFFLRAGLLVSLLPISYAWQHRPWGAADTRRDLLTFAGRSSLFIYWIHVEMVYGVVSAGLRKRFSLEQMIVVFVVFSAFLFGLARVKQLLVERRRTSPPRSLVANRAS